jgi:hypothetical protein
MFKVMFKMDGWRRTKSVSSCAWMSAPFVAVIKRYAVYKVTGTKSGQYFEMI